MVVPMVTTNLFTHPVFKDGAFTSNDRDVRRYRAAQGHAQPRPRRRARRQTYVFWGGREGAETDAAKDVGAALDRYREGLDMLCAVRHRPGLRHPVRARAEAQRAARRHLPADHRPRARRSSRRSSTARWSGSTPRSATSRWPGLNFVHGIAQALWQGKLFHIDLNGQHGVKFDQDLVFGHGDLHERVLPRRPARDRRRDGGHATTARATSTTSRCAPRTSTACGSSAAANMRTYLLLKERAAAFRADPEVQEALAASRVARARAADAGAG